MQTQQKIAKDFSPRQIMDIIDHTYLKTQSEGVSLQQQEREILQLLQEACRYGAYAVCVREVWVKKCSEYLREHAGPGGKRIMVASVVGFPRGDDYSTAAKIELLQAAQAAGAQEFDMVMNINALKGRNLDKVYLDLFQMSQACGAGVLKVIFENAALSALEKELSYTLAKMAFADAEVKIILKEEMLRPVRFFKTSTGFYQFTQTPQSIQSLQTLQTPGSSNGATEQDLQLMAQVAAGGIGLKASGGVNDYGTACRMLLACGQKPWDQHQRFALDPQRVRIGASSLLAHLVQFADQNEEKI